MRHQITDVGNPGIMTYPLPGDKAFSIVEDEDGLGISEMERKDGGRYVILIERYGVDFESKLLSLNLVFEPAGAGNPHPHPIR